jgi:hypothetical protein
MRKIKLNFPVDGVAVFRQKGFQLAINAISAMGLAHEIKYSQTVFPGRMAQTTPKLLKKYRETLRGPQEEHCI